VSAFVGSRIGWARSRMSDLLGRFESAFLGRWDFGMANMAWPRASFGSIPTGRSLPDIPGTETPRRCPQRQGGQRPRTGGGAGTAFASDGTFSSLL